MRKSKPLYKMVMDKLCERIQEGSYEEDKPLATEERIIQEYDVSRITAIRALDELERMGIIYRKRGCGSFVCENAKNKLRNESDEDLKKNVVEKAPVRTGTGMVAMVIPFDVRHGGMFDCYKGANEVLNQNGCLLTLQNCYRDSAKEAEIIKELSNQKVDGLICYPNRDNSNIEIYNNIYFNGMPIVLVDKYIENYPIHHVVSDNYMGGKLLCDKLIEYGHRKIGFFAMEFVGATSVKNRYFGYASSMSEHGVPVDLELVRTGLSENFEKRAQKKENPDEYTSFEFYKEVILEMMDRGMTAVICQNDWIAMSLYNTCKRIGINVPEDLSITGFDNISESEFEAQDYIKLTTIEQNFYEIGKKAAESVLASMEGRRDVPVSTVIPVKLIEGDSVRKL